MQRAHIWAESEPAGWVVLGAGSGSERVCDHRGGELHGDDHGDGGEWDVADRDRDIDSGGCDADVESDVGDGAEAGDGDL